MLTGQRPVSGTWVGLGRLSRLALAALLCVGVANVRDSHAESKLVLPYPKDLHSIPAATYDLEGNPVGGAKINFTRTPDRHVLMKAESGFEGGARNSVEAEFEILGEDENLRMVRQRSVSHDTNGVKLGTLEIDHVQGVASCTPPGDGAESMVLPLPSDDRVANVPMNLLFLPLIRGEVDRVRFQVFLCRGGPRFLDFVALRGEVTDEGDSPRIIEVRYGPDLGDWLSWAASRIAPRLSFWFDASNGGQYVAHRQPLFSRGPEVTVVRDGFSPTVTRETAHR